MRIENVINLENISAHPERRYYWSPGSTENPFEVDWNIWTELSLHYLTVGQNKRNKG